MAKKSGRANNEHLRLYALEGFLLRLANAERCHMGVEETPLLHRITGSQVQACGAVTRPGEVCVLTKSLTTDVSGLLPRLSGMRCTGTFERDRNWLVSLRRCSPGRFPGGGELESGRPSCSTTTPFSPTQ
jgi:hypothetical protein